MPHLPLADQLLYTSGACASFALAARDAFGGELRMLWAADERQFRAHEWPPDVPLCLHVFLEMPDGRVLDAEGMRDPKSLLRAFGVKRGYAFRLDETVTPDDVAAQFPQTPDTVLNAARALRHGGWRALGDVPDVSGPSPLAAQWSQAKKELAARRAAPQPLPSTYPDALHLAGGVTATRFGRCYRIDLDETIASDPDVSRLMDAACAFFDPRVGGWTLPLERAEDLHDLALRVSEAGPSPAP